MGGTPQPIRIDKPNAKTTLAEAGTLLQDSKSYAQQHNDHSKGVQVVINIEAITDGAGGAAAGHTLTFVVEAFDRASETYYALLTSAAYSSTGTRVLRVFPASTVTSNLSANDFLPQAWRVRATHSSPGGAGGEFQLSVGYNLQN